MPTLTIPEIAAYAAKAGFTGENVIMATGIAIRESGGRTEAIGDENNPYQGCRSWGLMQINTCPQYNNKGIWFRENPPVLLEPAANMRAAYEMSGGGQNWGPWSTYRAGIPAPDLERIRRELAGGIPGVPDTPGATLAGLPGPLDSLEVWGKVARLLTAKETWLRLLTIWGGVVLVIAGGSLIVGDATGLASVAGKLKGAKLDAAPIPTEAVA